MKEKDGVKQKTNEGLTTVYELIDLSEKPWNINPEKELLYIDAGAWQGDEKGNFKTNFVLISGNGVAVCNYYKATSQDITVQAFCGEYTKETSFASSSKVIQMEYVKPSGNCKKIEDIFRGCEQILNFLKMIDPREPQSHLMYFYKSTSRPFWHSSSVLIVIGDLHLHLFRQYNDGGKKALLDNFIKVEGGSRKSLEYDFCEFLKKIYDFKKSNKNIWMEIVQAGDVLDVWEIEHVFQRFYDLDSTIQLIAQGYVTGILTKDIPPKVNPDGLKKYMNKHVFPNICTNIKNLKSLKIDFIILKGNHDDALGNSEEYNEGPDYIVHIEHGHKFDFANKPTGDKLGRFLTRVNVEVENAGFGDWFKDKEEVAKEKIWQFTAILHIFSDTLPPKWRDEFINSALAVSPRIENKYRKKLGVFIMAHTHIPYAMKKPKQFEQFVKDVGYTKEESKTREPPPEELKNNPNFLLCLVLCYLGIPPGFFEDAFKLLLRAKWEEYCSDYELERAKSEYFSFREEFRAFGAFKKVRYVLTFAVQGKIGMIPIRTAAAMALKKRLIEFFAVAGIKLATLEIAEQAARKIHWAVEATFAAGCIAYCSSIVMVNKVIEINEAGIKALDTTMDIVSGFANALSDFIVRPLIVMRATVDPQNWDLSPLQSSVRGDFDALGLFLWAKIEPDNPNNFVKNISRPLNTYAIPPDIIRNISRTMTEAAPNIELKFEFPADVVLQMTPLTFVRYLKFLKLLNYKKDPEKVAEEAMANRSK